VSCCVKQDLSALDMLTCKVCNTDLKEVVITKCYHTFCKKCVHDQIKGRSRKCPACGKAFGQDDVHEIYL
jgi:E3 ubiquitin-protein ligase BRE1